MLTEVQKRRWLNNQKYTASWYTGKIATAQPYLKHLMREAREGWYLVASDKPVVIGPFNSEIDCYRLGFYGVASNLLDLQKIKAFALPTGDWQLIGANGIVYAQATNLEDLLENALAALHLIDELPNDAPSVTKLLIVAGYINGQVVYHVYGNDNELLFITNEISIR